MGARTPWQTLAKTKTDYTIQDKIDHIVVAMLENRSLDNLLGWLYPHNGCGPKYNIPQQITPTYDGLVLNTYWNTAPPNDPKAQKIYAARGVTTYPDMTPFPDPGEVCPYMYQQLFGTENPSIDQKADMSGFLQNYQDRLERIGGVTQIMECYTPDQIPVLNNLAWNFAVSDRWFGSLPCETFPNRSFVHAGSSFGRLNNCSGSKYNDGYDFDFSAYSDQKTIYQALYELGYSYKIYGPSGGNSAETFTATTSQFHGTLLYQPLKGYTDSLDHFESDASRGLLPTYCFVEPDFLSNPTSDQHPAPACSMAKGEQFIRRIWQAVSTSPQWKSTILIFTYDECGGCYDHVPPPRTATPPDASPPQFQMPIDPFTQYGTRIPAVVISPYVEAGTVFRSPCAVEFDHTSILATLRDWIQPPVGKWLASERVKRAPTIWPVLTRTEPRDDIPDIPPAKQVPVHADIGSDRLSSLQKGLMVKALTQWRFERVRAGLGAAATAAEHSAIYEKINKEVLAEFGDVNTANEAKRLLETP